ncbi:MAG TPA: tetraacyldisaccharide 4'-kinase, partial [Candidatus Krumholzibacteria bacterium]|nr:tetraacyldisaccharide 4'-kinase [Candidatus Krumholzibacteria bacterium]
MDILDHRTWPERVLGALDERDSPWSLFLEPASWIYRTVSWADRSLRPRPALFEPPLSVGFGNLRVGGTGKTPLVSWLCQKLRERG